MTTAKLKNVLITGATDGLGKIVRIWFVSACRKLTLTPGIRPPVESLIVPSKVPLVFKVCAAVATPTRTSSSAQAVLGRRLADSSR